MPRVLIVTAHPDDECMFFSPTILSFRQRYDVFVFCLTNGGYYGLGEIRRTEFARSIGCLAVQGRVLNNPSIQDGQEWDIDIAADEIYNQIVKYQPSVVLTFDDYGVSGHPDHIATHKAVRAAAKKYTITADILFLHSLPWIVKYVFHWITLILFLLKPPVELPTIVKPALTAAKRSLKMHKTQARWYRSLFIVFSAYTYVNRYARLTTG